MQKMLYFLVNPGGTYEGQLAGVNCRFREGRVYEVSERNPLLCAEIRKLIDEGKFKLLDRNEGMDLLEAQEAADRKRKQERLAAQAGGAAVDSPAPKASATVSTAQE